ncbi:Hint domain-containing protein [uncultured Litoreibacter sp.]|uniref:Hint domain-containing protein n=1 Tax=uncultured Litoreibacter sp. TaxID=1392394 RepID=UPI002601750A|nr:Hint domain-containing protein [uncultured Litoreibacter sp.]
MKTRVKKLRVMQGQMVAAATRMPRYSHLLALVLSWIFAKVRAGCLERIVADKLNGIFISELLADNAGGSAIDTDGDGNTNKSDEFIELQNTTGSTISLEGYEIWSEKNGQLHSFDASDTIAAGGTATIVGNYSGTPPAGFFDAGAAEGSNWIPDGEGQKFDTIFLVDTTTGEYIVLSYGNPPRAPTPPPGFPGTTQVGSGESIDSNAPNGRAFARDLNGDLIETTPTPGTPDVPCFLEGTKVYSRSGVVPVEALKPGAELLTKDSGYIPLRGIGRFTPSALTIRRHPSLLPIIFPKGSIGNNRDLFVSGSHRVLIQNAKAELLFGETETLAPARSLVGHRGIRIADQIVAPTYYHLLLDQHEVICAEGSWVESLFLADLGIRAVDQSENWTLARDFDLANCRHIETARLILKRHETLSLLAMGMPSYEAPSIAV